MIELLKHPLIDDVKTIPVAIYRNYLVTNNLPIPDVLDEYSSMHVLSVRYPNDKVKTPPLGYATIARYACGEDYHRVIERVFKDVISKLNSRGIHAKGYADISPISERIAGYLAGLGYLGKNRFLIHPNFGTYHFLGIILGNEKPSRIQTIEYDSCGECRLCIDACPTGALDEGFEKTKCLAYLTQRKAPVPKAAIPHIKTVIVGCDICQEVCPKNEDVVPLERAPFAIRETATVDLVWLLRASHKDIMSTYHDNAIAFLGAAVLKRNAMIAFVNQQHKDRLSVVKSLYEAKKDVAWFSETARLLIHEMEIES